MDLIIPKKLVVGFQERRDTFTGKLAYVVYLDEKNKLRQETSWNNWRNKSIPEQEFDNEPREGFVLNKGIKRSGYFGSGRSVIRVHDPREFEFEITVDNLIGILMHSDVSKRDIQEKCVYAWAGKNLVLLPVNSEEYEKAVEATRRAGVKFSAKALVPGNTYTVKQGGASVVYLGYYEWMEFRSGGLTFSQKSKGKRHVFHGERGFKAITPNLLADCADPVCHPEFSKLTEKFLNSGHYLKVTGYTLKDPTETAQLVFTEKSGSIRAINPLTYTQWGSSYLVMHLDHAMIQSYDPTCGFRLVRSNSGLRDAVSRYFGDPSPEMAQNQKEWVEAIAAGVTEPTELLELLKKQGWKSVEFKLG